MGDGERYRSWYLSREEIERGSPSRRDGVGAAKEADLRATYCSFIRDVCIGLQLPQITIATAILLCHRFYLRQSHAKNEWQTVATACVFLAAKIEDTPCLLKRVVIVAYETMYRKNPDAAKRIQQKEVFEKQKALILVGETLLLSTIRFDFNIQHPYEPLKLALKNLGISQKEVRQLAMSLINDTLPTTLVVQFKPHYIAAGSLYVAARSLNFILPSQNGRVWWHEFDVAPKQLQDVKQQMSELFNKRGSMGPAMKPTPTRTDNPHIKRTPAPTEKLGVKLTPALISTGKQQIKMFPTPILMDKQQIRGIPDPALKHTQYPRSFSNSNTEACRYMPVGSSFDKKSIGRSARNEENQYRRIRIDHNMNFVAVDQRLEEQSSRGTLMSGHVYCVEDMNATQMRERDLTRPKRRIQEVGRHPAPVYIPDTDAVSDAWKNNAVSDAWKNNREVRGGVFVFETSASWKKQKVERR